MDVTTLGTIVSYVYSRPTPLLSILSRPRGWRIFDYDGTRPCLPTSVMTAIAARLAAKKEAR